MKDAFSGSWSNASAFEKLIALDDVLPINYDILRVLTIADLESSILERKVYNELLQGVVDVHNDFTMRVLKMLSASFKISLDTCVSILRGQDEESKKRFIANTSMGNPILNVIDGDRNIVQTYKYSMLVQGSRIYTPRCSQHLTDSLRGYFDICREEKQKVSITQELMQELDNYLDSHTTLLKLREQREKTYEEISERFNQGNIVPIPKELLNVGVPNVQEQDTTGALISFLYHRLFNSIGVSTTPILIGLDVLQ